MNPKPRKPSVLALILLLILSYSLGRIQLAITENPEENIDLFTQKEPYSGKGPNMPSDAFGPDEIIILQALVTYNKYPVQDHIVAFTIWKPDNSSFSLSAETAANGVASVNFTVPTPSEDEGSAEIFGEWSAYATVLIGGNPHQDTLTFKVDWIVKLISIRTVDSNLTYRNSFGIKGDVGIELTLRSISMTLRSTMISIVLLDELGVPASHLEISNYRVQPNEKLIFLYCKLAIPSMTYLGKARILVSALTDLATEGGVAYCPPISTEFYVAPYGAQTISFRDVAVVEAYPSTLSIGLGETLTINIAVRNEGTEHESFNINMYLGETPAGTASVLDLKPYSEALVSVKCDTSKFGVGNHTIAASIPSLSGEADVTDNDLLDGVVEIREKIPIIVHDIAIVDMSISKAIAYVGEILSINVTVANHGNGTKTFELEVYYDSSLISNMQNLSLSASEHAIFAFSWNTSSIPEGFYELKSIALLEADVDLSDNTYVYGVIQLKTKPEPPPPPPTHDIAIVSIVRSSTFVYIGEILDINVTLRNKGSEPESFQVILYYNSNIMGTFRVNYLAAKSTYTHTFRWNTNGVSEGIYVISSIAEPVAGEENTEDNHFEDGVVTVAQRPRSWYEDWLLWLLLLLLALLLALLIALLHRRRRRKKKAEESFHSGWTAWYYHQDMQKRTRKPKS